MTASAQQTESEHRRVRVHATKSSDYTNFTLHPNWSLDDAVEVPFTLPAEAVEESGGPRRTFSLRPPAGLRPAVLLHRLAGDLAKNGKPALGRWLQAAETRCGPMPEEGAVEMVQLWHVHWELLDHDERMEAMGKAVRAVGPRGRGGARRGSDCGRDGADHGRSPRGLGRRERGRRVRGRRR